MAQRAKRRTKITPAVQPVQNGNGFHAKHSWLPGDPIRDHPLASVAGSFKDDPFWDEFVQAMKDARIEEDARYFSEREEK